METGCLEVVVNRKTNTLVKALRIGAIVLTVCFCLLSYAVSFLFLIPAVICAAGIYYFWLESVVDYEYVYVDRELRIAKIQQKQRRKEMGVYDLTKLEVLAPPGSYHLDGFYKVGDGITDYSSGSDDNKDHRYVVVLDGGTKLLLDLIGEYGEEILGILHTYYPRKVFKS